MRRLPALLSAIALTAALGACSSGAAPGWTYAPAPSATAAASGGASGAPGGSGAPGASASAGASAPASSAPSTAPSSAPSGASAAPSGGGSGNALIITAPVGAATGGFQPTTLTTAANAGFTIHFDNQDNQAPHNVELKDGSGAAVALQGDTAFFQGPGTRDYTVPPLPAGQYTYFCAVHPTSMIGTLTVQ